MPKKNEASISVVRARQTLQAVLDVVFNHMFKGRSVLLDLSTAEVVLESAELLKNLLAVISPDERSMLFIRSAKCRPAMRHAGHLVEKASAPKRVAPRFKVVSNPAHHETSSEAPVLTGKYYAAVMRVVEKSGSEGATNRKVSAAIRIPAVKATEILKSLHGRGLINRVPVTDRAWSGPKFKYTSKAVAACEAASAPVEELREVGGVSA